MIFQVKVRKSQVDLVALRSDNRPSTVPVVRIRIGEIRAFDHPAQTA